MFEDLVSKHPDVTFKKGETLLLKGEAPADVYIIVKGYVKLYAISQNGTERQIAILGPGEHTPVGWSLGMGEKTEHYHEAYTNLTVKKVPRDEVVAALKEDREALYKVFTSHEKRLRAMFARVSALEHSRANDKVAFMLLELADEVGTRLRPFKDRLQLKITQQEIADAIGLSRETTSSELKKLELENVIEHSRKTYVLYIERLRKYTENR